MKSSLKKKLVLAALTAFALLGWMALQPQPAQADPFCSNYFGKRCWTEGQVILCNNTGCPSWTLWAGSCSCEEGYWSCTPDTPCGGTTSIGGSDTALAAQPPVFAPAADVRSEGELWLTASCE
jgi:hypothetical protein